MKTIIKKPSKATPPKAITLTADGETKKLSRPRLVSSDAKGRSGQSYWTIKVSSGPPPKEWGITHHERAPHDELCIFQFGTLQALLNRLKNLGHKRSRAVNLARVTISETGYQVDFFPTLVAARAAEAGSQAHKETEKLCCLSF